MMRRSKQLYCIQIRNKIVSAIIESHPMQSYNVETGIYDQLKVSEAVLDWPEYPALTFKNKEEAAKVANEICKDARVIVKSEFI